MPNYQVPQFPLECDIFTGGDYHVSARLTDVECNLAWGRRVGMPAIGAVALNTFESFPGTMVLLVPKDTDIRDPFCTTGADAVVCPSGSNRHYIVIYVDDIGKGFDNEHRAAVLSKLNIGADRWPTPIP
jgi:hypothetical protein